MNRDYNHIKEWLDPKLKRMGLSIEKFARLAGLNRSSVYFYRNDEDRPSEQAMIRMCQVLGASCQEGLAQYTPKKNGRPTNPR